MPIETHIINYLHQQSKGVINLSLTQAKKIADMVLGTRMEPSAHVKIYKYDLQTGNYCFYRMVQTDDAEIKKEVLLALDKGPTMKLYMYECFNQSGEFEGKIYSINPNIF